jgi:hypothetical protein
VVLTPLNAPYDEAVLMGEGRADRYRWPVTGVRIRHGAPYPCTSTDGCRAVPLRDRNFESLEAEMGRLTPRRRKPVSAKRARVLPALGFRYSASRDAYVLRVVGNRMGPVYRVVAAPNKGAVTPGSDSANGSGPLALG